MSFLVVKEDVERNGKGQKYISMVRLYRSKIL